MSTVTKAISSVEFHVNARQANAALQSIQEEARKCREQVEDLQRQAAKGVTTVKVDGMDVDIQKRIREVKALQKTWESAAQSQIKGAKAFDELWKNARMGTIESMTGAQIKAGVNASKPIYDRLRLGDAEDRMKAQAIKDMQDQGQKVLNQLKTTTDQIIKQIADGETIAADVLEREARNLKSIMDLLPPLSQEWKDYNLQYQAINQQIERQTVLERQLRGEIVTREDAIRVINAANREATQQEIAQEEQRAKAAREAAEAKASEADQYRTTVEQKQSEIFATNDLIAAKRREIDAHHESAAAAKDAADKAREAAYKDRKQAEQEARNQQDAYNKQKKIRDDAAKDVEKFRKELEKLGEVKAEPKITVDTSELEAKLAEAKRVLGNASAFEKLAQAKLDGMRSVLTEQGTLLDSKQAELRKFTDATYDLQTRRDELNWAIEPFSRKGRSSGRYHFDIHDVEQQRVAVEKLDEAFRRLADDDYFKNASLARKYELLGTAAFGYSDAEQQFGSYERAIRSLGVAAEESGAKFRLLFQGAGVDKSFQGVEFLDGYVSRRKEIAQLNADIKKALGDTNIDELAREVDNIAGSYNKLAGEVQEQEQEVARWGKLRQEYADNAAAAERELAAAQQQSATATTAQTEQDEKRAGVQQKLADAETRLADENRKLNEQADKTITANQQAAQAANEHQQSVKALGDVMEENRKTGQRLGEEMGELTKQHKQQTEELADASEKMTDAEKESNRHIKTEQEARLRIQQLNNQSIEQLTASLRVLEEENRRINDPGNQRWQENERYIGQLNLRLEELKKQSAELRREPVLDMMTQRMQSLSTLSRDALTETKKFWEQMVDGAQKGSTELADYEQHLKSIALEEQARVRERGREAFAFFQREDYRRTNAADTEEQRKALVAYRDALPADATDHIEAINALLEKQAQFVKEAAGEWMSLEKAMELAKTAGTDGFAGSAKDIQLATQSLERQRDTIIATIREKRNLGQVTKTEEDQLADLTKKLRSLKFEQDNVNMSQEKMRTLIETPANAVNLDELRAAIKRADGQLRQMQDSLGQNSAEYKRFAEQVRQAKNVMKEMEGQAKASATAWEKAFNRLKTYVVMYMGFNEVWHKITGTARDLMDLSDRMGEVRKTTGFTADEVGRLSENLKKMDVRTSLTSLMEISASAGQLGLKTLEDVQGFTEAANKLMIALPEMGREAATEMMRVAIATGEVDKIRKQLQEGTIEGSSATAVAMEKIASTIDRLRASSASTAPEITDFVKRVGAVGAQSGITIDQVAALGSTVSSLGMRVEMSATALSRMIPAIRNNAFEIAKSIGVTPETVRELFDAGRGMEVILMILQRMKDANMDADSIESMMGMGGMRDIMKDLNQQGARAGIVFAGLSQNVEVLREQLGIASKAYEENTAIQNEFNKMNDTTAAKWERLKNSFEEMFVGDRPQRVLGEIIDMLRTVVDLVAGPLNGVITTLGVGFASYKLGLGGLVQKTWEFVTAEGDAKEETEGWFEKLKEKDVWGLVTSGVIAAGFALYQYIDSLQEAAREQARFNRELIEEQDKAEALTDSIETARKKIDETTAEVEEAQKAVDEAEKSLDGSREATDRLTEANSRLLVAEEKKKNAMADSKRLIEQFNTEYGKYLGFMLSEVSSNYELAKARDLVNTKLRETITLKRKEAAIGRVEENEGEDRDAAYVALSEAFGGIKRKQVVVGHDANGKEIKEWTTDQKASAELLRQMTKMAQDQNMTAEQVEKALIDAGLDVYKTVNGKRRMNAFGANLRNAVVNYHREYQGVQKQIQAVEQQFDIEMAIDREESQQKLTEQYKASEKRYADLETSHTNAVGDARKQAAADLLKQADTLEEMLSAAPSYYDLSNDTEKAAYEKFVADTQARLDGIKGQREELLKEAGGLYQPRKTVNGEFTTSLNPTNPWGSPERADSTTYTEMTAEQLVNRREQMNKFVNSLQTDTDVKAVLNEDKALKKAIEAGMSSDMRTVIEWYNTERLKIQDELHARHLTNTGDWLDPKKERMRKKQLQDEWNMYLREIDAYYTERKTRIEEAGTDEGLTEAEIRNRTLANEMEWRQRRAELQKIYADKSVEVTAEEQQAIFDIISERTGDDVKYVKAQIASTVKFMKDIGKMSEKELKEALSKLGLGWERDFLKQQQAVTQQMKAIQDIIDKERPFNGITKQLRESLATMDILTGDMRERYKELLKTGTDEEKKRFNEEQNREELRRTSFLLGEAEQAYSTTIDRVMQQMREKGMTAWADWLSIRPEQQEALMAQLRQTYDAIQDAIKKEASQLKKHAEIMWNNILVPGGDGKTTMKQLLDRTVAQLGIDQGRVSRANSLIGAGASSERVADKLAIQQMRLQLTMQEHYYNLMKKQGRAHVDMLNQQADAAERRGEAEEATRKRLDAQHAEMALNLATAKEETELAKQREEIIARTEESQNRLYTELRSWADLLTSSLQGVMEASHAGDAEYYNERAKLNLTGKGGPGAGTYVVIDDAGTSDAKAHYEYLDERQALERQHEIEVQNAQAEAWRKLMDDLNMKMSEQITDWMNAALQNQSIDANTDATLANTEALIGLSGAIAGSSNGIAAYGTGGAGLTGSTGGAVVQNEALSPADVQEWTDALGTEPWLVWEQAGVQAMQGVQKATEDTGKKMAASTQSTFAKMTQAANLYGIAYQTMSNDNLSASQKFQMFALQAAGNAAIAMLTTDLAAGQAKNTVQLPGILGKLLGEMPYPAAIATFAAVTALLGGLMGLAMSKVAKSKGEIAQATGASVGAGRLTTGMLTYAEGNVNELTDPASLTPGRQYNVDGADGKTYRARYMGKGAKTHITNGPEFHLVGEAGREAIIDANTTRLLQMNETGIWRDIQTLYNGGSISGVGTRRRRGGVRAFAEGNIGEFEDMGGDAIAANGTGGMSAEVMTSMLETNSRLADLLENALVNGIKAVNKWTGSDGIPAMYNKMQKEAQRHGEKYL